jgi:hypothetical protein
MNVRYNIHHCEFDGIYYIERVEWRRKEGAPLRYAVTRTCGPRDGFNTKEAAQAWKQARGWH